MEPLKGLLDLDACEEKIKELQSENTKLNVRILEMEESLNWYKNIVGEFIKRIDKGD